MDGPIVTRFAPSPTGHLHVGGARTALFNWALARGRGRYLLRIEDTDRARSSEAAVAGLLDDLAWLGIDWAEGPTWAGLGGDPRGIGPYFQAQRLAHYAEAARRLIAADLAYPAFETPEELDALRRRAQAEKRRFHYRRPADFDRERALARMRDEPHVVRFRMPEEPVRVVDAVLGEVAFGEEHLDDFVILKRDGFPTYHFSVVVDDEAMGVTHVLRGQEHLNNTPRHVCLQRALGYRVPVYAHLPILFNPDGSKMSKRDKDKAARAAARQHFADDPTARPDLEKIVSSERLASWLEDKRSQLEPEALRRLAERLSLDLPPIEVEDFRRAGFLPEVLCNYLALLGWSPGEKDAEGRDLERFDRDYLARNFSLERVGRGNAQFDVEKLRAFNQDAIAALDDDAFFARLDAWCERYAPVLRERRDAGWRRRYAAVVRSRCRTLADAVSASGPGGFALVADAEIAWDEKAAAKHLARGEPSGIELLGAAREALASLETFAAGQIEDAVRQMSEARSVGMGRIAQPLRVAVTGGAASPPLGDTLEILGRESVLSRIDRCLARFGPAAG
jgi:glutamyl-tRNA synthetase